MQKIRKPTVSGKFYSGNLIDLENNIKDCFLDERGPRQLPKINQRETNFIGLVVPHAGYEYSGAIAANSYYYLTKKGFADTFIIIGPNHTGLGSRVAIMTEGFWETPLGKVPINISLAKKLINGLINNDEIAHNYEHSIEVQLPFLQFCAKDKGFDFLPVCMAMQDFEICKEIGSILASTIRDSDRNIAIIASSDFSHVGFNYKSMPKNGKSIEEYAKEQDKLAIAKILDMDPEGLINTVYKNDITMCGYGPIAVLLTASKMIGAKNVELLKYGTSYEVHPSNSCVGYAALLVY